MDRGFGGVLWSGHAVEVCVGWVGHGGWRIRWTDGGELQQGLDLRTSHGIPNRGVNLVENRLLSRLGGLAPFLLLDLA